MPFAFLFFYVMLVVHPFILIHHFLAQVAYLINTGAEAGEDCKSAEVEGRILEAEETGILAEETGSLADADADAEGAGNQAEEYAAQGWVSGPGTAVAG